MQKDNSKITILFLSEENYVQVFLIFALKTNDDIQNKIFF